MAMASHITCLISGTAFGVSQLINTIVAATSALR